MSPGFFFGGEEGKSAQKKVNTPENWGHLPHHHPTKNPWVLGKFPAKFPPRFYSNVKKTVEASVAKNRIVESWPSEMIRYHPHLENQI